MNMKGWPISRYWYYDSIYLEGLRKTTQYLRSVQAGYFDNKMRDKRGGGSEWKKVSVRVW
jgi:hypothetical protein